MSLSNYEYYYIVKENNKNWRPILSPFIKTNNGLSGEFITASWFKINVPEQLEYAIIKLEIYHNPSTKNPMSTINIIYDKIEQLNTSQEIESLDFIVMTQRFDHKLLKSITERLRKKIKKENTESAHIHLNIPNKKGTFGMTFGIKKNEHPVLYCPCFDLYP